MLMKDKRQEIEAAMKRLGDKLEAGDDLEILHWIIPQALACAHRPLRHHPHYGGSRQLIPSEAETLILDWTEQIRLEGISSIISFMHDRDLQCYSELDLGGLNFIEFLKHEGFRVCYLPWEDPHHVRADSQATREKEEQMQQTTLEIYDRMPKPVLLQCSAGIDRSAPVAAHIWKAHQSILGA